MSFQPLKSPSYHCRNGMLFSNQHFRNSGEMRQKVIFKIVSEIEIFETVAKYDGESPSKIETKTNILQTSKQWHILLSHRQQNFEQDFPHWVLPNWSKMGCKLRKLDKINYFLPSNWNLLEYSNHSASSIPSLFSSLY